MSEQQEQLTRQPTTWATSEFSSEAEVELDTDTESDSDYSPGSITDSASETDSDPGSASASDSASDTGSDSASGLDTDSESLADSDQEFYDEELYFRRPSIDFSYEGTIQLHRDLRPELWILDDNQSEGSDDSDVIMVDLGEEPSTEHLQHHATFAMVSRVNNAFSSHYNRRADLASLRLNWDAVAPSLTPSLRTMLLNLIARYHAQVNPLARAAELNA